MAVQDDLHRLTQLDGIYIGVSNMTSVGYPFTSWFKGRVQQANDGSWIVRSASADGAIAGFQLGSVQQNWSSTETPNAGIQVLIPIVQLIPQTQQSITTVLLYLQPQLPQELTN